jgi:hypothetical protein
LELFDEVLVGDLSETSAFFGVEVDVVDPERGIGERKCSGVGIRNVEIREVIELNVNFNFVILHITRTPPFGVFV